jgi:coenzyme F420 hydrogenase subunit beta
LTSKPFDLPVTTLIPNVVESDQCIACGACIQACPGKSIVGSYSEQRGAHEVKVINTSECSDCSQQCNSVCPSLGFSFKDQFPEQHDDIADPRLGPIKQVFTAYSPENQFNNISSSGGVVRAFIEHFIKQKKPVICLTSTKKGYRANSISELCDLENTPGSIYHGISFEDAIPLIRNAKSPCLLVAIPCVLEGLAKYIKNIEPDLDKNIALRVGLICGWMYSDHSWKSIQKLKKISGTVQDVTYRGEDKVGRLKIKTDKNSYSFSRRKFDSYREEIEYKASFSRVYNRLRCRLCENHINQLSDIAVGDAWLKKFPRNKDKVSIVVVRTELGMVEYSKLVENSTLISENAQVDDIIESQSDDLVYGRSAQKLNQFISSMGQRTPVFSFSDNEQRIDLSKSEQHQLKDELYWRAKVREGLYKLYFFKIYTKTFPNFIRRKIITLIKMIIRRHN